MKLKIRCESGDLIRFCIFIVILFFLVAVFVSNLVYFPETGEFYGIKPYLALNSEYLMSTIVVWLIAIAVSFSGVKDYFFEFEKGVGIKLGKKPSDGYNSWCDKKTMKSELKPVVASASKSEYGGIPLINDGKTLWVDDGEYHNLVIGSTGSGKTQTVIFPLVQSLAKHGESMIITDPKGEIYEKTSQMLKARGYNIILLNFRNPHLGNSWNPLNLPYKLWKSGNQDKAIELLDDLALNILYDESNKNADPFWEKTSAGYFAGLALGLFEDASEEEININSISLMTTVGEERIGASSTYIKEYFNSKDPNSAAYINASSTILAPNETKGSILSVFKEKIKLFATRANLSEMLSYSDFDIREIGTKKSAVFIVVHDEKKTYHSLVTILVKQFYETLIDVAQSNGGKLPIRTNFLLDEFPSMPPLKDVTAMIAAARSRLIRFTFIIQNFAQLNDVYGDQTAETIKGNCGNLIYLISTELKALEEISKMCGEKKSKKDDKTASTPLITITDLQKLQQFEIIVRRLRLAPFKTKLTPDFKMNWGRNFAKVDIYKVKEREHREVKVFDVRDFVKKKKEESRANMIEGGAPGGSLPFFPGMPGMPGMGGMSSMGLGPSPFKPRMDNHDDHNHPHQTTEDDIDVDDIIKKIESQIAKIEEEEKALNEAKESDIDNIIKDSKAMNENSNNLDEMFSNKNKEVKDAVVSSDDDSDEGQTNTKKVLHDEDFNDDFFDDFFE